MDALGIRNQGWGTEETKNFDVMLKILVISLDTSYIHPSSNLKYTKKSEMQRNGISKVVWGGSHWILLKILRSLFIPSAWMAVAVSSGFLRFWSDCEISVDAFASWHFHKEWFDHQYFVVFGWNIYSQIALESFYLSIYFLQSPCSMNRH